MMKKAVFVLLLAGCAMPEKSLEEIFPERTVDGRIYRIFVPAGYDASRPWPCVVFLNGKGENGTDGKKHLKQGLGTHIRSHADEFPAVAVFPQCKGKFLYVGAEEKMVLDALAATEKEFNIDPARIYLTGISQGGFSTFDLGAKYPEKWAALLPICGAGKPGDAPKLAGIPLWAFHGEKDTVVKPAGLQPLAKGYVGSRDMVELLPGAKYTEFPGMGHPIWDKVYADPAAWEWLFAQKKK